MLDQITPVILTYNEAPNIERTLNALRWAKRIIVMDSFSDDDTELICSKFPNVLFVKRKFDVLATQWESAIAQDISTEWVLALDADYVVSDELITELRELKPPPNTAGYQTTFVYKIDGIALSGSLYPPVTTLYRLKGARYRQDGHAQRVEIEGAISNLNGKIFHDDRKPIGRWRQSQKKYAQQEAQKLADQKFGELKLIDKIRFLGLGPILVIPYTLILKGVIVNGLPGFKYAWQRVQAECYLLQARLTQK